MPHKDPAERKAYQELWRQLPESRKYLSQLTITYRVRNKSQWMSENGPCWGCGSWESLELDHVDRSQKVSSRVWLWSRERRAAELAKCQPLCKTCHKAKTRIQFSKRRVQ